MGTTTGKARTVGRTPQPCDNARPHIPLMNNRRAQVGILSAQMKYTIYNAIRGPITCGHLRRLRIMGLWDSYNFSGRRPGQQGSALRTKRWYQWSSVLQYGARMGKAWSVGQVRQYGCHPLYHNWDSLGPPLNALPTQACHPTGINRGHQDPSPSVSVALPASQLDITRLEENVSVFLRQALAPSTVRSYRSGQTRYIRFCHEAGLYSPPLIEQVLCWFVGLLGA